jgi:hypothetical protein
MEVGSEIVAGATLSVLKNIDIGAIRVVADRIAIGGRDNFGLAPSASWASPSSPGATFF